MIETKDSGPGQRKTNRRMSDSAWRETEMYTVSTVVQLYSDKIFEQALHDQECGVKINGELINTIRYADDTAILCDAPGPSTFFTLGQRDGTRDGSQHKYH